MNILVLNYEYPPIGGGAASVTREICKQYALKGNGVTVVTMGYKDLPKYENCEGVEIYRLKCLRSQKSSCMPWEQFSYIVAAKFFLRSLLKEKHYDVCHDHFVIPTGEVAKWVKRKYGIPVIITAHGSDVEGYNSKRYMRIMHVFLRPFWKSIVYNSYKTISPSIFLKKLLLRAYNKNEKYEVIPNGVDISQYKALADARNKEKIILVMGRMQKHKNMQTVIKAVSMIDIHDWKLVILGDGPYRKTLEELVVTLGLRDKVDFMGWIPNGSKEHHDILARASIFVSASEFENCPMAVIEAIAAGCYPLLSDIEAHRLLVPEDQFYFNSHDCDKLSELISRRICSGDMSFSYNLEEYDWENILVKYTLVLQEAINEY